MGVYLMGMYLMGMYLMGVHFSNPKRVWGKPPRSPHLTNGGGFVEI
jgi:hypothetical protein